jgi:hypothetical protein
MRTDRTEYRLVRPPGGVPPGEFYSAAIPYAYTNRSGGPVSLVNCNGDVSPGLQRRGPGGAWEDAWAPAMSACLSAAVVVAEGATYRDTLRVLVGAQDGPFYDELASSEAARPYRLVWHRALRSFALDGPPRRVEHPGRPGTGGSAVVVEGPSFGPPLPLGDRVSNAFVLSVR